MAGHAHELRVRGLLSMQQESEGGQSAEPIQHSWAVDLQIMGFTLFLGEEAHDLKGRGLGGHWQEVMS